MQIVGQNSCAPFCAFGDDSAYKDILVYAYAVFHRHHIEKAERRLSRLKRKFKIPHDVPVHCRVLFSGHQREKIGLSHLSPIDVKKFIAKVIERMNTVPCWLRYSYCRVDELIDYSEIYPDDEELIFHYDPKAILGSLSQSCFLPHKGDMSLPLAEDIEIFTSSDKTKVKFVNNKKRRADRLCSGFTAVGTREKKTVKLVPTVVEKECSLLQVADVFAYICSHALSKKCETPFFKMQLEKVKYWSVYEFRNDRPPPVR